MVLVPKTREGKIAGALLLVFFIAMNPPVVYVANEATTVGGWGLLYVWVVVWGVFAILALLWAARNDAFGLTEEQVPPEIRQQEDVVTGGGD